MSHSDYQRIARAIRYLEQHAGAQPSLEEVAAATGLSPAHFQRLFKRWAGVSPKRFLQFMTREHARQLLRASASVLDTALDVGLSGPGRLHDLLVAVDAVTPGEIKTFGAGLTLRYGLVATPFGDCLAAVSDRGLCHLGFVEPGEEEQVVAALQRDWPNATLVADPAAVGPLVDRVFAPATDAQRTPLPLLLRGTNFQLKVWEALLRIPPGAVTTYSRLAAAIGQPAASRAVGSAVGANPLAVLIPCHRVLRADGQLGGYRWGTPRKQALLGREAAARATGD